MNICIKRFNAVVRTCGLLLAWLFSSHHPCLTGYDTIQPARCNQNILTFLYNEFCFIWSSLFFPFVGRSVTQSNVFADLMTQIHPYFKVTHAFLCWKLSSVVNDSNQFVLHLIWFLRRFHHNKGRKRNFLLRNFNLQNCQSNRYLSFLRANV